MNDVTVGIKTFYRPDRLAQCLRSLVDKPFARVIVADDGEIDAAKQAVYDEFSKLLPMDLLRLDYDTGLAYGRNRIVEQCRTPFLLMLDDDEAVREDIGTLRQALEDDARLGGISAFLYECNKVMSHSCDLLVRDRYLFRHLDRKPKTETIGNISCYLLDQIDNATLFRTDCLRQQPWDEFYKIGCEHEDFYLSHKDKKQWHFAVTPDVIIDHYPGMDMRYKHKFRKNQERLQRSRAYFLNKWQLAGIVQGRKLRIGKIITFDWVVYVLFRMRFSGSAINFIEKTTKWTGYGMASVWRRG